MRKLLLGFLFLSFCLPALAAYLINVEQRITQPDGSIILCYASGDEFHNWLHDENNFTIMRHPDNGYWVYATEMDGQVVPSKHIVGHVDPATVGLKPGANISPDLWRTKREAFMLATPDRPISKSASNKNNGTLNNIVIFIRFSGELEFSDPLSLYSQMFNDTSSGANSMYNYFKEVSYNTLFMPSTFYPIPTGSTVISYQDAFPRDYYRVYDAVYNPLGYSNSNQRRDREHTLLRNAVDSVKYQIPSTLDIDYNNDGCVDNICFIIQGPSEGWSELLWPHRWSLYSQNVYIHGKLVYDYNFQLQYSLQGSGVGVLCHEMFHTLGAPDLYHYTSNGISPVGPWDVMASNANPPQHMGAFMKYKYGNWISSIPEITLSGTYTLSPVASSTNNAFRIASPYSTSEYFIIEYRHKTGTFENSLPGSGLLIYRINTMAGNGNASGPPDEVYVFRPDGTLSVNGSIDQAHFSSNVNRTTINATSNPSSFLSNGNPGGLHISNIGSVGTSINFTVNLGNIDPCNNVIDIPGTGPTNTVTFSGGGTGVWYTANPNSCGYNAPGNEQIFSFTPSTTGHYSLFVTSASGHVYYQWKATSCSPTGWTCMGSFDSPGTYGNISMVGGQTYYFLLDDADNLPGSHSFYIAGGLPTLPPANDLCSNATLLPINATCAPTNATTVGATQDLPAGACGGIATDDVWFRFVATVTDPTIQVIASPSFNAVVELRSGNCNGNLLVCSNNTGAGGIEEIQTSYLIQGATYRIRVYSANAIPGNFSICLFSPTVNIEQSNVNPFVIFPNPATDALNVLQTNTLGAIESIMIQDIYGRLIRRYPVNSFKENTSISLQEFPAGTYILVIKTPEAFIRRKFLKI